jgi:hypothetical protein
MTAETARTPGPDAKARQGRWLPWRPLASALGALAVLCAGEARAEEGAPTARAAVSAPQVELGRPFSLFVTVDRGEGVEVNLPSSLGLGEFVEEVRRVTNDRTTGDGTRVREFELQLIAWVIGDYQLPPIPVTYAVGGVAHQTQTNPVAISVISLIGEGEGSLRDIAPPVDIERTDWTWMIVALSAAGVLVLVGGFFAVRRLRPRRARVRARPAVVRSAPAGSARDAVLARLAELEARLGEADLRPVVFDMSEAVRDYLGRRFEIPALDMTTGELTRALALRGELSALLPEIRDWLEGSDLVKYAGDRPEAAEVQAAIDRARTLVEASWPVLRRETQVA